MPFPIVPAVNAGLGAFQLIASLFGRRKANRLARQNQFPDETIPSEIYQNQTRAKTLAATGLPSAQYNQAQQNIDRNLNATIGAASDRRGGLEAIGNAQSRDNDAQLGLDVSNANARLKNEYSLMNANNTVARYKDQAFDWNKKQKYMENAARVRSMFGAANQNLAMGADNLATGALGYGDYLKLLKSMYSTQPTQSPYG